jgi:hypothetical protein
MPETYAVFTTQGGGRVREFGGQFFFITKPSCPGFSVGDAMPPEWGIAPANRLARAAMAAFGDEVEFAQDVERLFDILFEKAEAGEISVEKIREFFPDGVPVVSKIQGS